MVEKVDVHRSLTDITMLVAVRWHCGRLTSAVTDADSKGMLDGNPAGGTGRPGVLLALGFLVDGQDRSVRRRSCGFPLAAGTCPAQLSRWFPLYDNDISFCLEDRAGVGVSDAWVQDNLSRYWGVNSQPLCNTGVTPDLRIIIEDFGSPQPAGWARWTCRPPVETGSPALLPALRNKPERRIFWQR